MVVIEFRDPMGEPLYLATRYDPEQAWDDPDLASDGPTMFTTKDIFQARRFQCAGDAASVWFGADPLDWPQSVRVVPAPEKPCWAS